MGRNEWGRRGNPLRRAAAPSLGRGGPGCRTDRHRAGNARPGGLVSARSHRRLGWGGGRSRPGARGHHGQCGAFGARLSGNGGPASCNPVPVPRNLNDPKNAVHNQCANTRVGNRYPDHDACVWAPGFDKPKKFDAFNGAVLWEVKTYNFDNGTPSNFLIPEKDKPEWERESKIARACNFQFWYTVGYSRHVDALNAIQPKFVPIIADNIEVDSANCLQP